VRGERPEGFDGGEGGDFFDAGFVVDDFGGGALLAEPEDPAGGKSVR